MASYVLTQNENVADHVLAYNPIFNGAKAVTVCQVAQVSALRKCNVSFGAFRQSIQMDLDKVLFITEWSVPTTTEQKMRSSLNTTLYVYFFHGIGGICRDDISIVSGICSRGAIMLQPKNTSWMSFGIATRSQPIEHLESLWFPNGRLKIAIMKSCSRRKEVVVSGRVIKLTEFNCPVIFRSPTSLWETMWRVMTCSNHSFQIETQSWCPSCSRTKYSR